MDIDPVQFSPSLGRGRHLSRCCVGSKATSVEKTYDEQTQKDEKRVQAQDALIHSQQWTIRALEKQVRDLRSELYAVDCVGGLTMDILYLSLDSNSTS
jgi:hypothetical protein